MRQGERPVLMVIGVSNLAKGTEEEIIRPSHYSHDVHMDDHTIEDARVDSDGPQHRRRVLGGIAKAAAAIGAIMGPIIALLNDLGCFQQGSYT